MMNVEEARALNKKLKEAREAYNRAAAELSVAEQNLDGSIETLAQLTGQEVTRENVSAVVKKQTAILEAQKAAIEEYLGA